MSDRAPDEFDAAAPRESRSAAELELYLPIGVICRVDLDAADDLRERFASRGLSQIIDRRDARRPLVAADLDLELTNRAFDARSLAGSRACADVWTSGMARTPYSLYVTSQADADYQLDVLSSVFGCPRDSWTIKPPRGCWGYGSPPRRRNGSSDEPGAKPWGDELRVYDDGWIDAWLLLVTQTHATPDAHARKTTFVIDPDGDGAAELPTGPISGLCHGPWTLVTDGRQMRPRHPRRAPALELRARTPLRRPGPPSPTSTTPPLAPGVTRRRDGACDGAHTMLVGAVA